MIRLRFKIALALTALVAVLVWISGYRHGRTVSTPHGPNATAILPKNETERITVNPSNHTVTIQTPTGIKHETLPDRQSIIDVMKDGTVKVTSPQYGFEHRLFFGADMSDQFRLAAGLDLFYWKRLDLGAGVGAQIGNHAPVVFAKVSYNIWSNVGAGITYDNNQHIGLALTVRL